MKTITKSSNKSGVTPVMAILSLALMLTLLFSVTVFAGESDSPSSPNPPPPSSPVRQLTVAADHATLAGYRIPGTARQTHTAAAGDTLNVPIPQIDGWILSEIREYSPDRQVLRRTHSVNAASAFNLVSFAFVPENLTLLKFIYRPAHVTLVQHYAVEGAANWTEIRRDAIEVQEDGTIIVPEMLGGIARMHSLNGGQRGSRRLVRVQRADAVHYNREATSDGKSAIIQLSFFIFNKSNLIISPTQPPPKQLYHDGNSPEGA